MEFDDIGLGVHAPGTVVFGGEDRHFREFGLSAIVDRLLLGFLGDGEVLNEEIWVLVRLRTVPSEVVDDGVSSLLRHVHPKSESTRPALREFRLVHSKENPETVKFFDNRIIHNF